MAPWQKHINEAPGADPKCKTGLEESVRKKKGAFFSSYAQLLASQPSSPAVFTATTGFPQL